MSNNNVTAATQEKLLSTHRDSEGFHELRDYLRAQKERAQNQCLCSLDQYEVFRILGELRVYTKLLDILNKSTP